MATVSQYPKGCHGEDGLNWFGIIPMARLGPMDSSYMKAEERDKYSKSW